jgi:hypothetical protein
MKIKALRFIIALVIFLPAFSCNAQNSQEVAVINQSDKVEAYYFHFNARCVTCQTVEDQAKLNIETLYPELVKAGKVSFIAVNIEEKEGQSIADRLGVNGQALLIVKGGQKINITNEGFLYAVSQPEKFKSIIKEKVDGLMDL